MKKCFVESRGRASLFQQLSAKCLFRTVFLVSGSCGSNLLKREIQKKVAGRTASSACLESEWMRIWLSSTLIIGGPIQESKTTA
jgi:hypothetical protein